MGEVIIGCSTNFLQQVFDLLRSFMAQSRQGGAFTYPCYPVPFKEQKPDCSCFQNTAGGTCSLLKTTLISFPPGFHCKVINKPVINRIVNARVESASFFRKGSSSLSRVVRLMRITSRR